MSRLRKIVLVLGLALNGCGGIAYDDEDSDASMEEVGADEELEVEDDGGTEDSSVGDEATVEDELEAEDVVEVGPEDVIEDEADAEAEADGSCGLVGDPCCEGYTCVAGLICFDWTCQECGQSDQPCCRYGDGSFVCAASMVCNMETRKCDCGGEDEQCCGSTFACDPMLRCVGAGTASNRCER